MAQVVSDEAVSRRRDILFADREGTGVSCPIGLLTILFSDYIRNNPKTTYAVG